MINRLFSVFVFVWVSSASLAESAEDSKSPLQLTIESKAREIVPCEPVQFKLILTNKTQQVVESTFPLAALGCVYVQCEDGSFQKWRRGWIHRGFQIWKPDAIQPGESHVFLVELVWQAKYPVFEKVGNYRIKADWNDTSGRITAETKITVVNGSERERQCLDELRRNHLLHWLGLDSDYLIATDLRYEKRITWREDLKTLFRIAKQYGDTRYAKYCLCSVLNTIESSLLRKMKVESVEDSFKREVVSWAEQRCAQRTDARTLYSYARYFHQTDKDFRRTLERVQKLLKDAHALKPDFVLAKRIEELGIKAQIDLRPK